MEENLTTDIWVKTSDIARISEHKTPENWYTEHRPGTIKVSVTLKTISRWLSEKSINRTKQLLHD